MIERTAYDRASRMDKRRVVSISRPLIAKIGLYALLTMAWLSLSMSGGDEAGNGNPLRQIVYLVILGMAVIAINPGRHPLDVIRIPASILITLAFCCLTILWSLDPSNSLRRLILTTMIISAMFALTRSLGYQTSVRIFITTLTFLVGVSVVLVIVDPGYAIHQENLTTAEDIVGSWRGIFGHKNIAGPAASILILCALLAPIGLSRWTRIAVVIGAAFFLYKTGSKTSAGIIGFCMAIGYLLALYRPRHAPVAAVLFMLCCSAVVLAIWYNWSEVSAPFLTEEALTGRGSIWIALQGFAQDHPFGAGFGSFWNISGHQPIDSYVGPRSWVAKQSSGHNGYLDLLVTIGPVGLALTVAAFAFFPMLRLLSTPSIPNNRRAFIASLLVYTLSANFTESTLLDRDQSVYVVLLFAISLVAVAGKTQTPQSPKPSRLLQKSRLRFGQWVGSAF